MSEEKYKPLSEREYYICPECSRCKEKEGLPNGVRWGIYSMSGNIVYLEPWEEKRVNKKGMIHHSISGCNLFEKE